MLKAYSGKLAYMPIMAVAMVLLMLKPVLMARFFVPEEFAAYSAGLLISSTFCMLGCLGLQSELQRSMPVSFYADREREAFVLLMQACLVAVGCFLLLGFAGLSPLQVAGLGGGGLTIGLFHGLSQQLFLLSTVESRSRGETLRYSYQLIWRAMFIVLVAVVVGWETDSAVLTLLAEAVVSTVLAFGILFRSMTSARVMLLARLATRQFARIKWTSALTLMGVTVVTFALINLDRWLAGTIMTPRDFAVYAFAWVILTAAQSAQAMINASVFPALAKKYAQSGAVGSFKFAGAISLLFLVAGGVLAWPLCSLIGVGVTIYFPDYVRATGIITIFYFAGLLRFSNFFSSFLIVIGRERILLIMNMATLIVGVTGWFAVFGDRGFADLTLLACFTLCLTLLNYLMISAYTLFEGCSFAKSPSP